MTDLINFLKPKRTLPASVFAALAAWALVAPIIVWTIAPRALFIALSEATGGLISPGLLLAPFIVLPAGLILITWGRLPLADLGCDARKLPLALGISLAFWLAMQMIQCLLAVSRGNPIQWHPNWTAVGASFLIGRLLGQLLANAPLEEIVFRHVAITQLMQFWRSLGNPLVRLIVVVLATQLFFWIMHFPMAMGRGVPFWLLVTKTDIILVNGFLFAWIYLQTRNLWIVMGFHALSNAPTPLVAETYNAHGLTRTLAIWALVIHLACCLVWRFASRRRLDVEPDAMPIESTDTE